MLNDPIYVEESPLPALTDKKMIRLAADMRDEMYGFKEARQELEKVIWPECDKAFMCFKDLPRGPNMAWVDNGALGESDLREAALMVVDQILLASMPPDETWLEATRRDTDEDVLNRIKDLQADLHHKAGTRDAYGAHITMTAVRGWSAIGCCWDKRVAVKNIAPRPVIDAMQEMVDASGAVGEDGKPIVVSKMREYYTVHNAPSVYPIDGYRLLLDPTAELGDPDIPSVMLVYKSMTELRSARDESTGKPLYDKAALADVVEMTRSEVYAQDPESFRSVRNMGLTLERAFGKDKVVPVYIFHRFCRETDDGDKWIDKFFYLAQSKNKEGWRIIRVRDNESMYGDKPFFCDTYVRWINCVYGTGMVEKSLSAYKAKNVLAALTLNAHVATVFPAMHYLTGVIKDDKKPILSPGGLQQVSFRMGIGLDFMKPAPINPMDTQIGIQAQQHLGAKILAQAGAMGAANFTDPNKSLSAEKTATQVRQESANAVIGRENMVEKFTISSLQPLAQSVYNYSRQHLTDESTGYVKRTANGEVSSGSVTREELDQDTTIEIVGRRGVANKAHEIANLKEALGVIATIDPAIMPTAALMMQDAAIKLLSRLGLPMKPEYKMSPEEIMAKNPQVLMSMLQQALQSPEGQQMAAEVLLNSPEGQQFLQQVQEMASNEGAAGEQQRMSERESLKKEAVNQAKSELSAEQKMSGAANGPKKKAKPRRPNG